jgi:3-oxoacyl-[acyl-carrier protein] reductase
MGGVMQDKLLDGKVAIVTGASRGIGRAVALTLARNGANVSLAARTETQLEALRSEIAAFSGAAAVFPTDVGREEDVIALVRCTVEQFGRLDIVVNNAGFGMFGPLETITVEQWDLLVAVNARGAFLLCREAIPYLRRQELSFIVNVSSVVGHKGYANQ